MKVLFLTHSFPRFATDPVGSFVLRLAVALRGEGVEVEVLAPAASGLAARERFEGIAVQRFRYAPRALETLAYAGTMRDQVRESWSARLALGMLMVSELAAAIGAARRFQPDVIHAHWWFPSGLVGRWAGALANVPLVTTLHGSDLRLARSGSWARRLARGVFRYSRKVTTVSHWLASGVADVAPGVEAAVVPMPVVTDLFRSNGRREPGRLLFVGKLNEQKGIAHLLKALVLMKHSATLDIVVGVGSDEGATRALADALGVASRLRWHPLLGQAELAELYRRVAVLVVPSVEEGLGLVAVEAALSETPVVAFDSGGLPDVVLHGRTGLLVPPGQPALLAAALDDVLGRPDQGATLGRAGREHALDQFSPAAVAARYHGIYREAIG